MPIDSTAELLFKINANADEAEANITRFRALMGTSVEEMTAQFKGWADETIGEITSVKAAMVAGVAVIAAGVLAAGVAIKDATSEYVEYASEVGKAMKLTGLTAEALSAMHSAATKTGVSFETLTNGLVKFESAAVKAAQGSKPQLEAFAALGISQKDVIAGQKDLLPLLEKVMDGFHNNTSAVQKAALARDLFSRGGSELIGFLSKGSEYLRENAAEAKKLGLVMETEDVKAAKEYKLALIGLEEQHKSLSVTIGRTFLPVLAAAERAMLAGIIAAKEYGKGGLHMLEAPLTFLRAYREETEKIKKAVETTAQTAADTPPISAKIKEAKEEFFGLTTLMDSLRTKIADQGTPWQKLREEVEHYRAELDKAVAELNKLHKEGKITADSYKQQMAALSTIPGLIQDVIKATTQKINAEETKAWGEAVEKSAELQEKLTQDLREAAERRSDVTREIRDREASEEEESYAGQRARLEREIDSWAAALAKKTALTEEDVIAIDRITTEGLAKIAKSQATAFAEEMGRLQEHLDQTTAANATAAEKLYLDYQRELQQYSAIEEQKALKAAQTDAQVAQIEQTYAAVRKQILQKYQNDLQQLQNSQGWQGVFGNFFAGLIRNNQTLWRQWATGVNQSILMVKATLQGLKEISQQTFQTFVQGMGQSIATAIAAKTSIGQAMEQMLKSTVESFAGQALTAAIMATAWGFYWLMLQNYTAAGQAFTSAAIFGTVGAAAAVAGRFMPSGQSDSTSSAGSSAGANSTDSQSGGAGSGTGSASGGRQTTVYLNVEGHVIGPNSGAMLADILNQAVYNNDVTLYASHTRQGAAL